MKAFYLFLPSTFLLLPLGLDSPDPVSFNSNPLLSLLPLIVHLSDQFQGFHGRIILAHRHVNHTVFGYIDLLEFLLELAQLAQQVFSLVVKLLELGRFVNLPRPDGRHRGVFGVFWICD